jgi:hypothetical protein
MRPRAVEALPASPHVERAAALHPKLAAFEVAEREDERVAFVVRVDVERRAAAQLAHLIDLGE